MINEQFISNSETETLELGKQFAKKLKLGDLVSFYGDLGAGKTEFIKGICKYFKVSELVTSPTFSIINQYAAVINNTDSMIYHLDLYRVDSDEELENIGFDECVHAGDGIKLVEWAENAVDGLPTECISVKIHNDEEMEDRRYIDINYNK